MRGQRLSDRPAVTRDRSRLGWMACGVLLILAGIVWASVAASAGYSDLAPLGGALLGVGVGMLIRWGVLAKKRGDAGSAPPRRKR